MNDYDEFCRRKILEFKNKNRTFLQNKLIVSFLEDPKHKSMYYETICNPTNENKQLLDRLFKYFYFRVRFTSHISSTLHFNSINHDKRYRKLQLRNNLTLDQKITDAEGEQTFKELIADENAEISIDKISESENILEHITCPILYAAIQTLSEKQRKILELYYIHGLNDTEIGKELNQTQQSISKAHNIALKKLHDYLSNKKRGRIDLSDL